MSMDYYVERQQAHQEWVVFNRDVRHPEDVTEPSRPNVPLLRKTLEHIESHPEEWQQRFWAVKNLVTCGTKFCFAGWAVTLAGDEVNWEGLGGFSELCRTEDGKLQAIAVRAANLLGLNPIDADNLFRASNSLEDLRTYCEGFAEQAGERL